jgi:hypothetical protein
MDNGLMRLCGGRVSLAGTNSEDIPSLSSELRFKSVAFPGISNCGSHVGDGSVAGCIVGRSQTDLTSMSVRGVLPTALPNDHNQAGARNG